MAYEGIFTKMACPFFQKSRDFFGRLQINPYLCPVNDHTPIHIHIIKDGNEAKYNVEPMELVFNHRFKKNDLSLIESLVWENKEVIIERWHNYFNK